MARRETPPETPVATEEASKLVRLFAYGTLNIHHTQRSLWGEVKQGKPFTLNDYELKMYSNNIFYIDKKFGEQVAGKLYEINEEQLKTTDWYETEAYERVEVSQSGERFFIYRRVKGDA